MIKIIESMLHEQTVTSVIDTARKPPSILSIRKGRYSNHDYKCASYHASRQDQDEIQIVKANGATQSSPTNHTLI